MNTTGVEAAPPKPLPLAEIHRRLQSCPPIPSLKSIQGALRELLAAEQRYAGQISEVIRRDPGLTSRLLRLVNSVHYGLGHSVTSLEEAVFYVGVSQVRDLATMTPVIEDFKRITGSQKGVGEAHWRNLWKHSIAVAMVTKDLMMATPDSGEDLDYVAGLVHDVGWIVFATAFPEHHVSILEQLKTSSLPVRLIELDCLGCDHSHIGALYLKAQQLGTTLEYTTRYHHTPSGDSRDARLAGAVQIADQFALSIGLGHPGDPPLRSPKDWMTVAGWNLLFPEGSESHRRQALKTLEKAADRLPGMVDCMV
ncbi:MAG: HDOD domain-containing protein [Verrucomicrobiota bacterium]